MTRDIAETQSGAELRTGIDTRASERALKRRKVVTVWHFLGLALVFMITVFPFYWMVTSSLKPADQITATPAVWIFTPTLEHYANALEAGVLGSLINSLIVALSTTALSLILGAPAAYGLARFEFRGKRELWFWFITNRMISPIVLALPIFLLARWLYLLDTHLVLVLVYLTFNLPIVVWICTDQFSSIPQDLEDAARLEGVSRFSIFTRIALPLAAPGLAVSAIFAFIFSWNELLYALVLTRRSSRTAPVEALSFLDGYFLPWGEIMATGTIIILPVVIFALMVSRHLVRGLTMGAVK